MLQSKGWQRVGHDSVTKQHNKFPVTDRILLLFSLSVVSDFIVTEWTVAHQTPQFVRFPRHEHWSGLPFHILLRACFLKG